jgi:hypothetical protein
MQVVDQAGPGVLVMRIALTDLVPTKVTDSVAGTLIPYGFVVEAGSGAATGRPAGSTPYMGETGMEMQFRDGGSGTVVGECRDTEIGRKYAADVDGTTVGAAQTWASGYLNSFQAWSYAKNAFDKWSLVVAKRLGANCVASSSRRASRPRGIGGGLTRRTADARGLPPGRLAARQVIAAATIAPSRRRAVRESPRGRVCAVGCPGLEHAAVPNRCCR